jgi:hypothetical protein
MQNGKLIIPASTQGALGNIATCGQLVGLVVTGFCQERYGAKRTFFWGMIFMIGTIFLAVFAQSMAMLMGAEFIMGIPWGMFQTLTTAYASGERTITLPNHQENDGRVALTPRRDLPHQHARLPRCVRLGRVGRRTLRLHRSAPWHAGYERRLGLAPPVRHPMDLARAARRIGRVRARE